MNSFNFHNLYDQKVTDSLLKKSIAQLFEYYDFFLNKLSQIDYDGNKAKWDKLLHNKSIDELSSEEFDKEIKHEIITRWFWIIEQNKLIKNGQKFNEPYLCSVGSNIGRKTLDREFHTYLVFVPFYNELTGDDIIILAKSESPDFIVENRNKHKIGIEITEALSDNNAAFEKKQAELLSNKLKDELKNTNLTLSIDKRPQWSKLYSDIDIFIEWLKNIIPDLSFHSDGHSYYYTNDQLSISIHFRKADKFLIIDSSGDGSGFPFIGDINEQRVSELIIASIIKKLNKKYNYPSMLIVYENTNFFATEFDNVIFRCLQNGLIRDQQSFKEIWITTDTKSYKLK